MSTSSKTASVNWLDNLNRKGYSMRKLLLASVAVFALSSAAQAANTATTVQIGIVNGSSVNQQGHVNDTSTTSQLGFLNSASTMQGTTSPSLNNVSSVTQIGVLGNSATTGQVATGNNTSGISQTTLFGLPPNNSAGVGQLGGGLNLSTITQH
jgi:major curlin subunit